MRFNARHHCTGMGTLTKYTIVYYGDIPVGAVCGRIETQNMPEPTLVILTLASVWLVHLRLLHGVFMLTYLIAFSRPTDHLAWAERCSTMPCRVLSTPRRLPRPSLRLRRPTPEDHSPSCPRARRSTGPWRMFKWATIPPSDSMKGSVSRKTKREPSPGHVASSESKLTARM